MRAEFLAMANDPSPLHLGESVRALNGPGVLKEMPPGRAVVSHGGVVESVFVGLGNGFGEARARRALPSLFPLDRERTWATLTLDIVEDIHECCRRRWRRCPMSPCLKDVVRSSCGGGVQSAPHSGAGLKAAAGRRSRGGILLPLRTRGRALRARGYCAVALICDVRSPRGWPLPSQSFPSQS